MTIVQANEWVQACTAEYTPQSVVEQAFAALGFAQSKVHYVAIAGNAGKTCVASLEASILSEAGFAATGCYVGGATPLRTRITIDQKPVPAKIYGAAVAAVQKLTEQPGFFAHFATDFALASKQQAEQAVQEAAEQAEPMVDEDTLVAAEFGFTPMQPIAPVQKQVSAIESSAIPQTLSVTAAEFLVACLCFTKSECNFAVMELAEPAYATMFSVLSACAITQIGVNAQGHSAARSAKAAIALLRKGVAVITTPTQPEEVLAELTAQAKTVGAMLTVPDLEDFTEKQHRRLQNRMEYGGYEVMLPYLGAHAELNAAIAIELALAIWRTGFDISDDAILQGLSLAQNEASILPVQYTPMVVVDSCNTPMQAATFAQWVKAEDYQAVSLIVGFTGAPNLESFFSALETGTVVDPDNPEKDQLPGMADNAFQKVYAVMPDATDAVPVAQVVACGKFHFDITPCKTLGEALALAQADANDGVAVCGSMALAVMVKKRFDA